MTETKKLPALAETRMKAKRFGEAIELYEKHLAENPDDLAARMRLGICLLLNRSEQGFIEIYHQVEAAVSRIKNLGRELARLWAQYQSLFAKVTATALLVGTVSLSAADAMARPDQPRFSGHRYSGGVSQTIKPQLKPQQVLPPSGTKPVISEDLNRPQSSHRYSGGVYKPPRPVPPATTAPSSHRYSGGVFRPIKPGS
jgi:hypothetical protein